MGIKTHLKKNGEGDRWMITYASLLTAVLAFFIMIVTSKENEAKATFRLATELTQRVHKKILQEKELKGMDWLDVEYTGTMGIRLLIPSMVNDKSMFASNSSDISSEFDQYLNRFSQMIASLDLDNMRRVDPRIKNRLTRQNRNLSLELLVQGHTDILPVRSGDFESNWDLSTARAYSLMAYLKNNTGLPDELFALAGYGPFLPKSDPLNYSENRRVEIYIKFQMETVSDHASG